MRLIDKFSKEEIDIFEDNDFTLEDREYSLDEIYNIRSCIDWYWSAGKRRLKNQIVRKLKKIEDEYPEKFKMKDWKYKLIVDTETLKQDFEKSNLIGKRLIDIHMTGIDTNQNKYSMITGYNNDDEIRKKPGFHLMKKIRMEDMPEDKERSRFLSIESPIIMDLDDGRHIEILIKSYSKVCYSINKIENRKYYSNIDINQFYKSILNKRIIKYEINKMPKNHQEKQFVDKRIINENNILNIIIYFENGFYLYFGAECIMLNNELNNESITMGEYKKIVKHYDWLFSDTAE